MRNFSVFDIIGPIMIGPSSSHTAGAARLAKVAASICNHRHLSIALSPNAYCQRQRAFLTLRLPTDLMDDVEAILKEV